MRNARLDFGFSEQFYLRENPQSFNREGRKARKEKLCTLIMKKAPERWRIPQFQTAPFNFRFLRSSAFQRF
jgi:hypothetical protein